MPTDPERVAWIWFLLLAVAAPDVLSFIRSLRICIFKNTYQKNAVETPSQSDARPNASTFLTVFVIETLSAIGTSTFVFHILPAIDVIQGAMIANALCLIPAFFIVLSGTAHPINAAFNWLSMLVQLLAIAGWSYLNWYNKNCWYLFIPILLVSLHWWENFIEEPPKLQEAPRNWLIEHLWRVKSQLQTKTTRCFTFVYLSIWRIIVIFTTMLAVFCLTEDIGTVKALFYKFPLIFEERTINYFRDKSDLEANKLIEGEVDTFTANHLFPLWILLAHIGITYFGYATARFACKICIQPIGFALPVSLTVPVLISSLASIARIAQQDMCLLTDVFFEFQYVFWTFDNNNLMINGKLNEGSLRTVFHNYLGPTLWVLSLISQLWITIHVWTSTSERLAATDKLFIRLFYDSTVLDQSLAMNRRRIDDNAGKNSSNTHYYETIDEPMSKEKGLVTDPSDYVTKIIACACMWHEEPDEMMLMLKSVMRLDVDQRIRQDLFKDKKIGDYYELEVHILFDDAFIQGESDAENDRHINDFVKRLIETMDAAASSVHGTTNGRLNKPQMIPTPYGGRLVWTLPGGNNLIVHLKDKTMIRHGKRWSQCMYLYYLFGHQLAERPIPEERKEIIAENTFILALDGDINFRPIALHLLIDLMKKDRNLGAACGRIHPTGAGLMVWYQKFEYAIAHWLQKATEHVFGCVLCSPGCFSLFRAKALMDDSVMNKYKSEPTEAMHYLQYEQGEDRWLCTLMLQRGWRVEYSAASDSFTRAPEDFGTLFKQRRRWAPSTVANIIDLLRSSRQTVAANENISRLYIFYQAMLMVGTLLSPGTIFLMVVGALNTVMGFRSEIALLANLIPILSFAIFCFLAKNNDYKIFYAQILSVIYALLMLAVLVGTAIEMFEKSVLTPNSIFFLGMIGSFIFAAVLHPQEFNCVLPLFIYLLCVPSMYLLLTIYSIIELHDVSWGTREVKTKLTAKEQAAANAAAAAEAAKKKAENKGWFSWLDLSQYQNRAGSFFCCTCCSMTKADEDSAKLTKIEGQLDSLCEHVKEQQNKAVKGRFNRRQVQKERNEFVTGLPVIESEDDSVFEDESKTDQPEESQETNQLNGKQMPVWTSDAEVKSFPKVELSKNELAFWTLFIEKYMKPKDADLKKQAEMKSQLISLRNQAVFAVGIINTIFILFVFLLQMHKDIFGVQIPAGVENYTRIYNPEDDTIINRPKYKYVNMDPIGLVLVVFFGTILIIQLIGMFLHRFGTLTHLLASVDQQDVVGQSKDIANIMKKMQKVNMEEVKPDSRPDSITGQPLSRRPSMFSRPQQNLDIGYDFRKRLTICNSDSVTASVPQKRKNINRLAHHRPHSTGNHRLVRRTRSDSPSVSRQSSMESAGSDYRFQSFPGRFHEFADNNLLLDRRADSRV